MCPCVTVYLCICNSVFETSVEIGSLVSCLCVTVYLCICNSVFETSVKIGSLVSCLCVTVYVLLTMETRLSLSTLVSWIIPNRTRWTDFPDHSDDILPWYNTILQS